MSIVNSFNSAARNRFAKPFDPQALQGGKNDGGDGGAPPAAKARTVKALDVSKIARAKKSVNAPDASKIKRNDKNNNGKK